MRTFDLAPLYRSTVGFDRLFSMLDGFEAAPGYPPYNIERTGENDYRITVAVAGFGENELSIEAKENTLTIKGAKQAKEEQNGEVLYQGIAARAFERVFQLADHVQVKAASLENGLLHVDLVREIPEAKKPRQIPIGNGKAPSRRWSRPRRPNLASYEPVKTEAPRILRGAFHYWRGLIGRAARQAAYSRPAAADFCGFARIFRPPRFWRRISASDRSASGPCRPAAAARSARHAADPVASVRASARARRAVAARRWRRRRRFHALWGAHRRRRGGGG